MKLSIVATLYKSASYINKFYERTTAVARQLAGDDYEIIFVNDGSPDDSLDLAITLTEQDSHVIVIDLSRNFGHHKAMMTGLDNAIGELVFLIDSDLEEKPEWLLKFAQKMNDELCDVVYGVQKHRKGNWFERFSGQWFYYFFNTLTKFSLPINIVTARLMTRPYVESLLRHQEREIFLAGLWYITGFDQRPYLVQKDNTSKSSYTLSRKLSLLVNAVTSFSSVPLISIFYMGVAIFLFALTYNFYLLFNWLFYEKPLAGWTSVIGSIWLFGGLIISFIGVIGIYLAKVFSETKQRPYTIVRKIYGKK